MARRSYSQSPYNRWKYKSSGSEPDISNSGVSAQIISLDVRQSDDNCREWPGQGPHFDPHEIALGLDGSIFTAEVIGWRSSSQP
jgi:hypothetical protein